MSLQMVRVGDNIYPVANIQQIKIDKANLALVFYFTNGVLPVKETFATEEQLGERVKELTDGGAKEPKKPRRLFG